MGARRAPARARPATDGDDGGVALRYGPAVTAAQHRPVACPTLRSGAAATFAAYRRSETQSAVAFSASESGVLDGRQGQQQSSGGSGCQVRLLHKSFASQSLHGPARPSRLRGRPDRVYLQKSARAVG